jgi:hypothetical protein
MEVGVAAIVPEIFFGSSGGGGGGGLTCMCEEGLYCQVVGTTTQQQQQQCVVAPAGTYAAGWSNAPVPCPIGTAPPPYGEAACLECPLRPSFTTHAVGSLSCQSSCEPHEIFSDATQRCVQGCNVSRYCHNFIFELLGG